MAKQIVTIKFIVSHGSKSDVTSKQAKIETDATVEDLIVALSETEAFKGLMPKQSPKIFVAVPKGTLVEDIGLRENDVIIIMGKDTGNLVEPM